MTLRDRIEAAPDKLAAARVALRWAGIVCLQQAVVECASNRPDGAKASEDSHARIRALREGLE